MLEPLSEELIDLPIAPRSTLARSSAARRDGQLVHAFLNAPQGGSVGGRVAMAALD
jgi:hypothetical protein